MLSSRHAARQENLKRVSAVVELRSGPSRSFSPGSSKRGEPTINPRAFIGPGYNATRKLETEDIFLN
jgi:hypothetical protein